ncbi:putative E3 ubiquitin-protein ligase RING1a isoform X3 [Amaranthus tricolor]|uniref:putative E3 ubiquitin-protein ligase RING1a isoform X3 n=1 Tax=Amaranthus tricolor TaxID=29722 RepID=UPI0025884493|nr:putative E3 ubiquitin-protein ligase RING1a isoform X3 [Amaranthus tricolor]
MLPDNHSPELINDQASSHLDSKLRRSDVPLEHQPSIEDVNPHDERTTPPVNFQQHFVSSQEPKLEDDTVLKEDSDSSHTEQDQDPSEFVYVDLQAIRKEVQCPICLGIIKKTRTVMECLHRFCRECIDKSIRMGNNECPACRTHCASRRSLRDDPRFDELIAALYPDIKKFEEEELAFYQEDEARNKQIQESITQVLIKQSEALGKKRPANKDTAGPSQQSQSSYPRRKRRRRNSSIEYQDYDDNDDAHDSDKQFVPDEHHRETKPRKARNRGTVGGSHSPSTPHLSGGFDNNVQPRKEEQGISPVLTSGTKRLSWGRGGARSNNRHGKVYDVTSKNAQRIRLAKLVDFLHNMEENGDEFAALQMASKEEKIRLMGLQDVNDSHNHNSVLQPCNDKQSQVVDLLQVELHRLNRQDTAPGVAVASTCISNGERLILSYPRKEAM